MSWDVHHDVWLAPIDAAPEVGVFDDLDARVVGALAGTPRSGPSVPPPPPSAAFDAAVESTSYESGDFMAEAEPEAEPEPEPSVFVIPNLARPADTWTPDPQPAVELEPEPEATPEAEAAPEVEEASEAEELGFVIPSLRRAEPPGPESRSAVASEGELVIPSLRRDPVALEPEPVPDRLDVELVGTNAEPSEVDFQDSGVVEVLDEVHELEEIVEQPVRTGDTVISAAPTGPGPQDLGVASPVDLSGGVADSVYDDDEEEPREPASPEQIARVDSAELEILPEEVHEPEPFVIPTLASPVGGITPAEIVLPMLARMEPEPAIGRDDDDDDRAVHAPDVEAEEVEEFEVEEPASSPPPPVITVPVEEDAPEARPPTPPPNTAERRRKAWYDDVFAEHYLFLYPPTWEETARRDAEFIHASLGLPAGSTVLDVGCGDGRHALELGKLGLRVTGLDNSLALLLAAAQHKEQMGIDDQVAFLHGDMRRLPRDRQFDAVMCVGSTLGYFEEDQNRHCLDEMLERLTPTGRLLLHVFNRDFVAPQLPARSWWQGRRCMVLDEAEMNFFANRLRVHRTIIFDDGRQFEHYMFMRAFTVHDLGKTLSQMGMRVVEVSGSRDTRKRFYGAGSPDIWIVAERKA